MRFIPKNRLKFEYVSPEGPLCLFFQGNDNYHKRVNSWKFSIATAAPGSFLAYYLLGMTQPWVYPMLFLPTFYYLYDLRRLNRTAVNGVEKLYLY